MKEYRWAVIGCGVIANEMAAAMNRMGRSFYSVANRTPDRAVSFAKKYHISKVYPDIASVFADEAVDIVYIATPHNTHFPFIMEALRHGKHVLCEKAITLNSMQLDQAIALAKKQHLILAEATTLYHMPLFKKLRELTDRHELGPLRFVQMNFGSYKEYDMDNRFFSRKLAGGALLDIGIYALSFTRWFLSEAPDQIVSQVKKAPTGVDEQAGILLMNPSGEMASLSLTLHAKQPKRGTAAFDKGYIEIYNYPRGDQAVITYTDDGHQETLQIGSCDDALLYEIRDMEETVSGSGDLMCLSDTKDVMDIMTKLRQDWKITYPEEETGPQ